MSQKQLKLFSWNINGIRAAEKKGFLDWLRASGADVVALQETKASPEQVSAALRQPDGYHVHWNAAQRKGYSGVATFSRFAPLAVTHGLDDPRFDADGRVLVSRFADFVLLKMRIIPHRR